MFRLPTLRAGLFLILFTSFNHHFAHATDPEELFFSTDVADAIYSTASDLAGPIKRAVDAPRLSVEGQVAVVYPVLTFAAFKKHGTNTVGFVSASNLNYFVYDDDIGGLMAWRRYGGAGGVTGNLIQGLAIDSAERVLISGNTDPSGTYELLHRKGFEFRRVPDASSIGGYGGVSSYVVSDDAAKYRFIFVSSGGIPPKLTICYSKDGGALVPVNLTQGDLISDDGKPLLDDSTLWPAFTYVSGANEFTTAKLLIGWSRQAGSPGYKTVFAEMFVRDVIKLPEKIKGKKVGRAVESQLLGMTRLINDDVIASFYGGTNGGQIVNVNTGQKLDTKTTYPRWVQRTVEFR